MTPLEQLQDATAERQSKRRRPAKPVKPPEDAERYYRAQLRSLVQAMAESIERHVVPTLKRIKSEYTADSWSDDIEGSLEAAWAPFAAAGMEVMYQRLAREFVSRVAQDTTERLVRSVNQAAGVNLGPIFEQDSMRDFMNVSIEQNTSLISSVPEEYFKRVRTVVYEGVAGKTAPTTIASRIQEATGVSYRRARVIARDQNSRITSQVNERRQGQAGIKYYRAVDAGDERVTGRPGGKYPNARISCWGIARKDIGYGKGVYTWKDGASWGGETGLHPGRHHINCFPSGTRVAASKVRATMMRRFKGDLVTIRTASGKELTATPNHPILTRRGWVAIGELTESDNVVCASGVDVESGFYPDDKDVVSSIENVSTPLFVARGVLPVEVEVSPKDFHGDGADSNVCVVHTDSLLNSEIDTPVHEHVNHGLFKRAIDCLVSLFRLSRFYAPLDGDRGTFGGLVGSPNLSSPGFRSHSAPLKGLGFRLASDVRAVLSKYAPYHGSGNAKMLACGVLGVSGGVKPNNTIFINDGFCAAPGDNALRFENPFDHLSSDAELSSQISDCAPGGIFFDDVISVSIQRSVDCHVHNLETESGAYLAEGILTHNCRCTASPVFAWEVEGKRNAG